MRLPKLGPGYLQPHIPVELREHYHKYMDTVQWRTLRRKVLIKRAKRKCELCPTVNSDASVRVAQHVHHLTYDRLFFEKMTDLLAVCYTCHALLHPGNEHLADQTRLDEIVVMEDEAGNLGTIKVLGAPQFVEPEAPRLGDGRHYV